MLMPSKWKMGIPLGDPNCESCGGTGATSIRHIFGKGSSYIPCNKCKIVRNEATDLSWIGYDEEE